TQDGELEVPPVITSDTMTMDAVQGIMFFGFSNFKLLPRNNDDFIGLNVPLDSTNLPQSTVSVLEVNPLEGIRIYPNPARDFVYVDVAGTDFYSVELVDMAGAVVAKRTQMQGKETLDLSGFKGGMYILRVYSQDGKYNQINRVSITR
ncbi:MAG: T9SS type A sorting domain-containing protein, partial [Schleiferiaceae bacterium]|nr:T9SS type A sorting domain-containing protein [Schleiferiaceae bacterium]